MKKEILIYQNKNGAIELRGDFKKETLWASLQQLADLFETDKSGISRHIRNIYQIKELDEQTTVAKIATVQVEGNRKVERMIDYYNLDVILSVGYRVNSVKATAFRQWATKICLHKHITEGFTVNKKQIAKNYQLFFKSVDEVKSLMTANTLVKSENTLELVKMFALTWFSLDAYDNDKLPKAGQVKGKIKLTPNEMNEAIESLKQNLISKNEANNLFGMTKSREDVSGIFKNLLVTYDGKELYPTIEEKAAHLLYFMVKDHPFIDGNKRIGAFTFIWFLKRTNVQTNQFSSEALTALTLLVAGSMPKDKDKMIGLIILLTRGR